MKLLFKQRIFAWLDSYDIYDEDGNTVFTVKGEISFGHLLRIYDAGGREIGHIKQEVLTFLPKFYMYIGEECVGSICKEFSLFTPKYNIDYKGWHVEGEWAEWDYSVKDTLGREVAAVSKQIWKLTDTYVIDVRDRDDVVYALMLVLAIDAEKCSRND